MTVSITTHNLSHMPDTYISRHGIDWPIGMHPTLIDLTVAKKHRTLAKQGLDVKDPWTCMLTAARSLLPISQFSISKWTEQHAHDFVMYNRVITWGCASSSKSNDYGLFALLDWITDPIYTLWVVGSTTKVDLTKRTWEAVARYHSALMLNDLGLAIPGKLSERGQTLSNIADADIPESTGGKAAIVGMALNEEGRLQGSHLPYVRVFIDELATIRDHEALRVGVSNLLSGTTDFRFYGLANPEPWASESSRYCLPQEGVTVNVDTGSWMSARGYFVRHHDGMKSPCVVNPSLTTLFPYLMKREEYEEILKGADGNEDDPVVWKMVRGFPAPTGSQIPTFLDPLVAEAMQCGSALPSGNWECVGSALGIDPAWSEGGDDSMMACPDVKIVNGKPVIDFTGKIYRTPISASSNEPVTKQQRDAAINILRGANNLPMTHVAVDCSGNQGLADDLDMYISPGCMHVNNSERASELPLRAAGLAAKARDTIYDRGTESWIVLAEFCRAGMVRGLSPKALAGLVNRRFATRGATGDIMKPLRSEPKDKFNKRFRGSPNETDACALAALVVKERIGVLPFGHLPPPTMGQQFMSEQLAPIFQQIQPATLDGGYEPEFSTTYEGTW